MRRFLFAVTIAALLASPALAHAATVLAAGAGYRSLVDDLADAYTATTGCAVDRIYGNMARVTAQARLTGAVDLVLGDKAYLDSANLSFADVTPVGMGRLVVAYPKGGAYSGPDDLLRDAVTRIAIPDPVRAIYGNAATHYLRSTGVADAVQTKLLIVSTVPQAASYVTSGEVDYAFINLTHARRLGDAIGGYTVLDQSTYDPIAIIIARMQDAPHPKQCADFTAFLATEQARAIVASHGL